MKNVPIRPSIQSLVPSATLQINERSKQLQADGKTIYRLGFGQSPFPIPTSVVRALCQFAGEKDYLPVQGLTELREAVSSYYHREQGLHYGPDQIMIGPGSKELILSIQMVCDADLLLPSPSWVSYEPQNQIAGSRVDWVQAHETHDWLITAEELENACLRNPSRQKILILNYPSNPVGSTYQEDGLRQLAEVARSHDLIVVSDEIYGALHFEGHHLSLANYYPEGTVVSGGLSKWCGAGGWRLGTFCFPNELQNVLHSMRALASESFSAVSAPVQHAAVVAFRGNEEIGDYLHSCRRVLRVVADYVHSELRAVDVTMPRAKGGFYLFPNFNAYTEALHAKGIRSSVEMCERLLEETGVALLPGSAFGRPPEEFTCRLSFVDFDGQALLDMNAVEALNDQKIISSCPKITSSMKVLSSWLQNLRS